MTTLDQLLREARADDRTTRIRFRDPLAAYGRDAIKPLSSWLGDQELGAFAVRVLRKIGEDGALRTEVITVLASADPSRLSLAVQRDLAEAIAAMRPPPVRRSSADGARNPIERDRGRRDDSTAENRFHNAMLDIYWLAGEATGYWASYFLRGVRNKGGLVEAKDLLRRAGTSPGFERLKQERRLDLSMEALVIRAEFGSLFTDKEIELARRRLQDAGFVPD